MCLNTTLCRHCGRYVVSRPRGLCHRCYYAPGVKECYPPTAPNARRGVPDGHGTRPLPAKPTRAFPGSAAKLRVLEERAAAGVTLWHPDDPTVGPPVIPWQAPQVRCGLRLDEDC